MKHVRKNYEERRDREKSKYDNQNKMKKKETKEKEIGKKMKKRE